ncbi:hypothetical protein BHE74_00041280 [Ensete ventricosum]|nr:hypothetical protein BHE74_00041280 [Ensete ventricosum]
MGSKPWLIPVPNYRRLDSSWETDDDEDAPGPRCAHSLTAVDATKSRGARLILFGGATAIEGGASSAVPGISNSPPPLFPPLALPALRWCFRLMVVPVFFWCEGLAGVTNSVHSYDVNTGKWTRCGLLFIVVDDLRLRVDFVDANAAILFSDWQDSSRGRAAFSEGCTCRCIGWDDGCFPGNKIWKRNALIGVKQVVSVLCAVVICCRVVVQGPGPGPRYGHTMDLVAQRYLVTVSGNDDCRCTDRPLPDGSAKNRLSAID